MKERTEDALRAASLSVEESIARFGIGGPPKPQTIERLKRSQRAADVVYMHNRHLLFR